MCVCELYIYIIESAYCNLDLKSMYTYIYIYLCIYMVVLGVHGNF